MAEKEKTTMRQWIGRGLTQAVLAVNLLTLVPSLLGLLAPYLSPGTWWMPSVCAMAMPWPALVPLFWALVWLAPKFKIALVNLVVLALHWPALSHTWQFNGVRTLKPKDFTLLSFNVDAFQYKQKKLREIANFIENRHPDVVCFQEYRDGLDSAGTAAQYLKKRLGYKHKAFVELIPETTYGLAFFSKYPIARSGLVTDPGPTASNGVAFADVKLYGQTLRVYNVHLESYKFSPRVREAVAAPPAMSLTLETHGDKTQTAKSEAEKTKSENLKSKTGGETQKTSQSKSKPSPGTSAQTQKKGGDSNVPKPASPSPAPEKTRNETVKTEKTNAKPENNRPENKTDAAKPAPAKADAAKFAQVSAAAEAPAAPAANPAGRKRKSSAPPDDNRHQTAENISFSPESKPVVEARSHAAPAGGLKYYWKIVKELLRTWDKHLEQIYRLSVHRGLIQSDEYDSPGGEVYTVVCGDLNNPPYNYMYRQVRQDLNDAFLERGSGRGTTYGQGLKSFRIDYVFTDKRLDVVEFRTLDTDGLSDHAALYARLRFGFH